MPFSEGKVNDRKWHRWNDCDHLCLFHSLSVWLRETRHESYALQLRSERRMVRSIGIDWDDATDYCDDGATHHQAEC